MSTTTGFNVDAITEMVNETAFGTLWYKEPIMQNNTVVVAEQYGTFLTGAKNDSYKLPTYEATATVKDGSSCGFTPTDQVTLDQTDLDMVSLTIQGQFCPRILEPFWVAAGLPAGQHYEGFNPLEAQMLSAISEEIAKKVALFPYYGPTGSDTATYTSNWIAQLEGATGIVIATGDSTNGGSAGTDAAGVWNRVEAAKNLFLENPDTAGGVMSGDYIVELSPYDASLYYENMRTLFGQDTVVPLQAQFAAGNFSSWIHPGSGIRCVVVNALGTGREIIMVRKKNKVLAFDLASDSTRLEMGMDQYREFIWWKWRCKMGTGFRSLAATSVRYYGDAS